MGAVAPLGTTSPPVTDPLLRAQHAPATRTLVDVLRATADAHPDSPALDNGRVVLTYDELLSSALQVAVALREAGAGRGDRVGVRIPSGTTDLYVAIVGILLAGAAYVPVDRDDPDERARLVFGEAGVAAVVTTDLVILSTDPDADPGVEDDPLPTDEAWVIFTSGSTGTPKGVAVSHRSAAAFVDAEARMFVQHRPLGPGDRVMAGLSVAFDASCEEMWLAWRYGACLVPAPRSLVRSGMDLGPWLRANDITVVSTVPTLVTLWPPAALDDVRLLILGGEACPPEIGARLATDTTARSGTPTAPPRPPSSRAVPGSRRAARADRAPARRLGPRRRRRPRQPGRPGRARRARHRRGRPGQVPRPREGRGRVRADADPGLGSRLPQRGHRALRRRGPGLPRPGRRPGQARRPAHRARRGRQRAARAARRERRRRRRAAQRGRQQPARRLRHHRARLRRQGLRRAPALVHAGRARAPARRRRHAPDAHLRQDRPRRAAVAAARPTRLPGIRPADRARRDGRVGRRALDRDPRRGAVRTRRRLLRPRRWQPHRRPARLAAARAVPRGDGRRRLRPPGAGRPRCGPRRDADALRPAERRRAPGAGHHAGGPGAGLARLPCPRGPALAHLGRGGGARRPWAVRARLAARRRVGLGAARLAAPRAPGRAHHAGGRRGPRRCSPGCAPGPTAAVAPCT